MPRPDRHHNRVAVASVASSPGRAGRSSLPDRFSARRVQGALGPDLRPHRRRRGGGRPGRGDDDGVHVPAPEQRVLLLVRSGDTRRVLDARWPQSHGGVVSAATERAARGRRGTRPVGRRRGSGQAAHGRRPRAADRCHAGELAAPAGVERAGDGAARATGGLHAVCTGGELRRQPRRGRHRRAGHRWPTTGTSVRRKR